MTEIILTQAKCTQCDRKMDFKSNEKYCVCPHCHKYKPNLFFDNEFKKDYDNSLLTKKEIKKQSSIDIPQENSVEDSEENIIENKTGGNKMKSEEKQKLAEELDSWLSDKGLDDAAKRKVMSNLYHTIAKRMPAKSKKEKEDKEE